VVKISGYRSMVHEVIEQGGEKLKKDVFAA